MASFSRHYTLHVTASVVMIMALPAVSVWLFLSGYTPFAVLLAILAVAVVFRLIRLLRYPISQTEMMARAIKNNDLMLHIPETDDVLLRQASADMNRILLSYRRDQNELDKLFSNLIPKPCSSFGNTCTVSHNGQCI